MAICKKNKKTPRHFDFTTTDFQWHLQCDYETIYSCDEVRCNPYCRCGVIVNTRITDFNCCAMVQIIESILKSSKFGELSKIDQYCLDRIFANLKINEDSFDINVCGGYYGQEIKSITLQGQVAKECNVHFQKILSLKTLRSKVEYLLNFEYGYLLDSVKNRSWRVGKINKSDLIFGQLEYLRKIRDNPYGMEPYPYYKGVVVADGEKYRLIDGYHRCQAAETESLCVLIGR